MAQGPYKAEAKVVTEAGTGDRIRQNVRIKYKWE